MPVAAGSPWLLPFFVCDPWSPWPFLGLVLGPLYCVRSWSGSCGVDYFFAHLAFLVPQLPRHFHFLPALLLVGQCKEALLQAAGSFVCLAGSTETWGGGGKGWKVCGCQPFRRRLTWMMARLLISVHEWHCLCFTPGGLPLVRGAGLGSSIACNSPARPTDSFSHLQAPQQVRG